MISKIGIYGGLGGKVGGRKATDGGNAQKYGDAVIGVSPARQRYRR